MWCCWDDDGWGRKVFLIRSLYLILEYASKGHLYKELNKCDYFGEKRSGRQMIDGLDKTMKTKKGEVTLLKIQRDFVHQSRLNSWRVTSLSSNATVYYAIKLVSFIKGTGKTQNINPYSAK